MRRYLVHFRNVPLVPLTHIFSRYVSCISSRATRVRLYAALRGFEIVARFEVRLIRGNFHDHMVVLIGDVVGPFGRFFDFKYTGDGVRVHAGGTIEVLAM